MSVADATDRPSSVVLPSRLDSFVGRKRELADTTQLLNDGRLLTLVGPGGAGKTRLALRLAERLAEAGLPTVALVDLTSSGGSNDPVELTAAALGVRRKAGGSLEDAVIATASELRGLLLFDNCEPAIEAVARFVHELLNRCPGIRALATSQEILGIPGEAIFPVEGLALARGRCRQPAA